MKTLIKMAVAGCWVAVLAAEGLGTALGAQPALQPRIVPRPLTPGDVTAYQLPSGTEVSGGLTAIGLGQPAYLEVEVNSAVSATNILSVVWTLSNAPIGSMAVPQPSPLGPNVPIFEPADRLVSMVAGRALVRPDLEGEYTVLATITTLAGGVTNLAATLIASTNMGVDVCALCHSGGLVAPNKVVPWSSTVHATMFTRGINGLLGQYNPSCLPCHTVGYDPNTNAVNGGFDDVASLLGWQFPTVLTNGNWTSLQTHYPALANVANIQCENCHGPGSEHALSLGDPDLISLSAGSGVCGQCHDRPATYAKNAQWNQSLHAVTTRIPTGPGRQGCVGCHTALGFIGRIQGASTTNTTYVPITCQTCHDPHGETIPTNNLHLLRTLAPVTLPDGTTITNGGMGLLCMECHHSRADAATDASSYRSFFGPHNGPQADMLRGANAFTYGQAIPSSAHHDAVRNTCVTCHMQTVASNNVAFYNAGGHTFNVSWDGGGTNAPVDLVAACQNCHGPSLTDFDFPLQDYDGDGVIDGVQTEVQHLLDKLGLLLPPVGQPKSSVAPDATWTTLQLQAAYNYMFVQHDGSLGIHNTAYAVGVLKASIASLTGDANNDGLPDSWQILYFSSINNPDAAPNASPAGDGVPNWMKYALGLDPTKPGLFLPTGVVWINGKDLVNPPINPAATNAVEIFAAAEVAFNTQLGETYQIQSSSALSGGWQDVGNPIPGTGTPVSYVLPTRDKTQMFFRVLHTP